MGAEKVSTEITNMRIRFITQGALEQVFGDLHAVPSHRRLIQRLRLISAGRHRQTWGRCDGGSTGSANTVRGTRIIIAIANVGGDDGAAVAHGGGGGGCGGRVRRQPTRFVVVFTGRFFVVVEVVGLGVHDVATGLRIPDYVVLSATASRQVRIRRAEVTVLRKRFLRANDVPGRGGRASFTGAGFAATVTAGATTAATAAAGVRLLRILFVVFQTNTYFRFL